MRSAHHAAIDRRRDVRRRRSVRTHDSNAPLPPGDDVRPGLRTNRITRGYRIRVSTAAHRVDRFGASSRGDIRQSKILIDKLSDQLAAETVQLRSLCALWKRPGYREISDGQLQGCPGRRIASRLPDPSGLALMWRREPDARA